MPYLLTFLDTSTYPPRLVTHGTINVPTVFNTEREAIATAKADLSPGTIVALAYINPKKAAAVETLEYDNG